MNISEPQFDPDFNSENFQSILERMIRAKWIVGTNIVTPDRFWFNMSDLGNEQMRHVDGLLKQMAPEFFETPQMPAVKASLLAKVVALAKFQIVVAKLQPPMFTPGERDTLIGMFLVHARKNGESGTSAMTATTSARTPKGSGA